MGHPRRQALCWSLLSAWCLAGCVSERGGIVLGTDGAFAIEAFLRPTSDCSFPDPDEPPRSTTGVLDLALAREYRTGLLVRNLAHDNTDHILVRGLKVAVFADESQTEPELIVQRPAPGFVEADQAIVLQVLALGQADVNEVLAAILGTDRPDELTLADLADLRQTVTLEVSLTGMTFTGRPVATAPVGLAVELCLGCLVRCTAASLDELTGNYCESPTPPEQTPCWLGQDDEIDCRDCAPYLGAASCRELCVPR